MDALSKQRVEELLGKPTVAWSRVTRGYTPAERWLVRAADGSSAFVKIGATPLTAQWLQAEQAVYRQLKGPFMPRCLGSYSGPERPLLVLEDLSGAVWPPPWRPGDVQRLLACLRSMSLEPLARGALPELERDRGRFAGWLNVERDPAPFLSLGLCSQAWLLEALPSLLVAQDLAWLGGSELVHGDLRSDNLCFLPERVVLVDWNGARRGNAQFDLASLAPSLRLEGGPLPDELLPGEGALAALICGYFAANAGREPIPDAPQVRWIQQRQLRIALPWAARALGLPAPDGSAGRAAIARLRAAVDAGELDETSWFAQTEELLGDLYLASDDPRAQSGKSGDEVDFRWSRELILDALPALERPALLLDVGAANGYLLQRLGDWASERGQRIELYGLEISPRLAALAHSRAPALGARIQVGNVLDHRPERRYDLVHTALDYVPKARQKQSIERIQREFLAPGGRVVLRPERVQPGTPDLVASVEALGLRVGGVVERQHPVSGVLRRSVWLEGSA